MIIGRYLQWVETAPVAARVDAARSLVDIYASPDLDASGRSDVELALFALLDDPVARVRQALAEAVAHTVHVPRHLVAALAQDQSCVATPVLRFSPLLEDADLIEAIALGDATAHRAMALRPLVRDGVAVALVEAGDAETAVALCGNDMAELSVATSRRMLARFGMDGGLREAMLKRGDLDAALRHDLVVATASALTSFAIRCEWMSKARADQVTREARDKAAITIATNGARHDGIASTRGLVAHLRASGYLTPALMLRAVLSGHIALFEAAISDLSSAAPIRVSGLVRDAMGLGFSSLYAKAGLPPMLLPVFRAALVSLQSGGSDDAEGPGFLRRRLIIRVLDACKAAGDPGLGRVAALLRRFEAEAVRDEARAVAANAWAEDSADIVPALLPWIVGSTQTAPRLTLQPAAA